MPKSLLIRYLARVIAVILICYVALGTFVWWAMHQPPERFGRIMARIAHPAVLIWFPFETMWLRARSGNLQPGDAAPDFYLRKLEKSGFVQLSSFKGRQPVVL